MPIISVISGSQPEISRFLTREEFTRKIGENKQEPTRSLNAANIQKCTYYP